MNCEIDTLHHQPQFADTIAERGWKAWWTDRGVPLSQYRAHLEPMMAGENVPFALVAHKEPHILGPSWSLRMIAARLDG